MLLHPSFLAVLCGGSLVHFVLASHIFIVHAHMPLVTQLVLHWVFGFLVKLFWFFLGLILHISISSGFFLIAKGTRTSSEVLHRVINRYIHIFLLLGGRLAGEDTRSPAPPPPPEVGRVFRRGSTGFVPYILSQFPHRLLLPFCPPIPTLRLTPHQEKGTGRPRSCRRCSFLAITGV